MRMKTSLSAGQAVVATEDIEMEKESAMKVLQWIASVLFFVASVALLCMPSRAEEVAAVGVAAFAPTRFTVTDAGTVGKPDVVMIPGLSSSKAVWDGEAKLLAPNYRLHILQVDGFAGAPAGANAVAVNSGPMLPGIVEELHGYIGAFKMHPAVVGHSLGGLLALMLADKYPGDVAKLVIVDSLPFYGLVFNAGATVENVKPQADVIKQQMLAMPADQFAAMQPMMAGSLVKDEAGAKAVVAASVASDRGVFAEAMYEDLQTDLRADMAKITAPTMLLYPFDPTLQKDEAAYDALYKGAYAAMPDVKLVRVEGSRHFIMYDQPEKLDAAVEGFLK